MMLRRRFEILSGLVCAVLIWGCTGQPRELGQGDVAPAWTGMTFDGAEVSFPDLLDGKPAVFVIWATWCSYCKAFMPYLREIQAEYGADRINVLAINAKEDGSGDPASYVRNLGFPVIAIQDGDAIADAYDVEYIPGLMVIDAEGVIEFRRAWTDLPAGTAIATAWSQQVRQSLNRLLN
jgi:thiol-disulfide isomerase/thioredoxin